MPLVVLKEALEQANKGGRRLSRTRCYALSALLVQTRRAAPLVLCFRCDRPHNRISRLSVLPSRFEPRGPAARGRARGCGQGRSTTAVRYKPTLQVAVLLALLRGPLAGVPVPHPLPSGRSQRASRPRGKIWNDGAVACGGGSCVGWGRRGARWASRGVSETRWPTGGCPLAIGVGWLPPAPPRPLPPSATPPRRRASQGVPRRAGVAP